MDFEKYYLNDSLTTKQVKFKISSLLKHGLTELQANQLMRSIISNSNPGCSQEFINFHKVLQRLNHPNKITNIDILTRFSESN